MELTPSQNLLRGWSKIAKHLDLPLRTAKRYHTIKPMPLRMCGGMVVCDSARLDSWFNAFCRSHTRIRHAA